jgi:hypothetical protein
MSTYIKSKDGCKRLVDPLIIRDIKSIQSWGAWGFIYGDATNSYVYVFIPGIYVTDAGHTCTVVFSSNQFAIKLYSNSGWPIVTFSSSEYLKTTQQSQGIMLAFKKSGIGYGGYGIITSKLTIS